jgi:hypothetical protein
MQRKDARMKERSVIETNSVFANATADKQRSFERVGGHPTVNPRLKQFLRQEVFLLAGGEQGHFCRGK